MEFSVVRAGLRKEPAWLRAYACRQNVWVVAVRVNALYKSINRPNSEGAETSETADFFSAALPLDLSNILGRSYSRSATMRYDPYDVLCASRTNESHICCAHRYTGLKSLHSNVESIDQALKARENAFSLYISESECSTINKIPNTAINHAYNFESGFACIWAVQSIVDHCITH